MYRCITLLFSAIYLSSFAQTDPKATTHANVQPPKADCTSAKDSLKKKLSRNELDFYTPIKYRQGQYYFVTIDKNKYKREIYPAGYPAPEFMTCYNKEAKHAMDSVFKTDFFNRTDSILLAYDKSGHGYNNVEYPGGPGAMQKFLNKNVNVPKDTKSDDGKPLIVLYSFDVDEKGAISNVKMMRSNCKACNQPVADAIQKMPPFIPARDAGVPKKVKYMMPYTSK